MRIVKFGIIFFLACVILPARPGFCAEKTSREEMSRVEKSMISDGDFEKAVSELNEMIKASPEDPRLYMDLALAYYGLMEYSKAYDRLKEAERIGRAGDFQGLLSYATSNIEENRDVLRGIEDANSALHADADNEILREQITGGHIVMLNETMKDKYCYPAVVVPHIIWLKENMDDLPGLYEFSGDVYYSSMFYGKAVEDYKKAIEIDPENVRLLRTLADCQVALGDLDSAQDNYEKAIELYKKQGRAEKDPEVLKLVKIKQALPKKYGDVSELIGQRRFSEAEEICKKRISLNPGDYAAITQLGQVYWEKGQRKAAIRLFRKVTRFVPDYPTAHFFLGRAYFFEKKPEKGFAEFDLFKEKMELLPEMDEEATDFYVANLHYICYMYSTLGSYSEAMAECRKIIKLKPDDQRAHYNLAVCYYLYRHNRSRAYSELQKIIEIDPHTRMADMARYYIDYMRRNPDSRIISDFTFLYEE